MANPQTETLRLGLKAALAGALGLEETAFRVDYGQEEGSFACTAALAGLCDAQSLLLACPKGWEAREQRGFVNFRPGEAILTDMLAEMAQRLPEVYPLPKDAADYGRVTRMLAMLPCCPEEAPAGCAYIPLYWEALAGGPRLFPRFEAAFRREYPPVFLVKAIIFQILQKNACISGTVVVK